MSTFTDRLKLAAKEKGVSLQEARAEIKRLTGMSRSNLTHWFTGRTKEPKGAAAAVAAEYLEVLPLWLAKGFGEKRVNGKDGKMAEKRVTLSEDAQSFLRMYQQLPDEAKPVVRRQLRDTLELLGEPGPDNPFGQGKKRRPAKKPAAKKKRPPGTQ